MKKQVFRFKQFNCVHGSGSMKIGVDAVLIGAWAGVGNLSNILEVGTGCGVISLMCAQRFTNANIIAIDIDKDSVLEAEENVMSSPWKHRIKVILEDFNSINLNNIDLILSNPPYFNSGILTPDTPRLKARHQDFLSPVSLITRGVGMLSENGSIAMIVPSSRLDELIEAAHSFNLILTNALFIKGNPSAPIKRVLTQFSKSGRELNPDNIETMILEELPGKPSEQHKKLCGPFYLNY